LVTKQTGAMQGGKVKKYVIPEKNFKPFKYSLLGFSVGALVIYAVYIVCKKE
jgi:hypothetical protein